MVCALIALVLLTGLLAVLELRLGEYASFNTRLLKDRTISMLLLFQFCITGCLFILVFFLPLYFQMVHEMSPEASGIRLTPLIAIGAVSAMAAGVLCAFSGDFQFQTLVGAMLATIGCGLI